MQGGVGYIFTCIDIMDHGGIFKIRSDLRDLQSSANIITGKL